MSDNDVILIDLLGSHLEQQNAATTVGFNKLDESMNRVTVAVTDTANAAQRDFRILAFLLLAGLLASMGISTDISWGDVAIDVTPAAQAHTISEAP